jgi:hypothetical protein
MTLDTSQGRSVWFSCHLKQTTKHITNFYCIMNCNMGFHKQKRNKHNRTDMSLFYSCCLSCARPDGELKSYSEGCSLYLWIKYILSVFDWKLRIFPRLTNNSKHNSAHFNGPLTPAHNSTYNIQWICYDHGVFDNIRTITGLRIWNFYWNTTYHF